MRWLIVVALAVAACGDNVPPVDETPDAAPVESTIATWSVVTLAIPAGGTHTAWDPDRQVLVLSNGAGTWENIDGTWHPSNAAPSFGFGGMYFDPQRHQVGALGQRFDTATITGTTQSWNGFVWHPVQSFDAVQPPVAGAYDPELGGPVVVTYESLGDGNNLDGFVRTYDLGPVQQVKTGELLLHGGVVNAEAIYDPSSRSVIFAAGEQFGPQGFLYRMRDGVFRALAPPLPLSQGFALGTVDGFTELVVDGRIFRLASDVWTRVDAKLPRGMRPTALWQPRSGERHVVFADGEYVQHDGAWLATPMLTGTELTTIARAPDGSGFDLFTSPLTADAVAEPLTVWRVQGGALSHGGVAIAGAPLGQFRSVALYAPGRGADVIGLGSDLGGGLPSGQLSAFDGTTFTTVFDDDFLLVQPNQAAADPEHGRVAAIISSGSESGGVAVLADHASFWEHGPTLPLAPQFQTALAFDPSLDRLVVTLAQNDFPDRDSASPVWDLINDVWVRDDGSPRGQYMVATDERYGLVAFAEGSLSVAERTRNVWSPSPALPLYPTAVLGTAYDPERHELAILAEVANGVVVLVRRRD